jgi:hypothetical protein
MLFFNELNATLNLMPGGSKIERNIGENSHEQREMGRQHGRRSQSEN